MGSGRSFLYVGTRGSKTRYSGKIVIHNNVTDNKRVGSALKSDTYHNFPDMVDNHADEGHKFSLIGGDGKHRELYQVEGSLNGRTGIFEWIHEPGKGTTHRRFIANGKITGTPNQVPQKGI